jgi:hypothetical protein
MIYIRKKNTRDSRMHCCEIPQKKKINKLTTAIKSHSFFTRFTNLRLRQVEWAVVYE